MEDIIHQFSWNSSFKLVNNNWYVFSQQFLDRKFLDLFLKFKNDRIEVWWRSIQCIIISIISNIYVIIFKKEVANINVKKKWS